MIAALIIRMCVCILAGRSFIAFSGGIEYVITRGIGIGARCTLRGEMSRTLHAATTNQSGART